VCVCVRVCVVCTCAHVCVCTCVSDKFLLCVDDRCTRELALNLV
jgi:hypothetical protein